MKNFTCIAAIALLAGLLISPASGVEYATDFLEPGNPGGVSGSLKTFDDEWTIETGHTVDMDIWVANLPEKIITAGFFIDYDESMVAIVNCDAYDGALPGPWDADMTNKVDNPSGPGTYMVILGNLGSVSPDSGGDIPMAKITFSCISPGGSTVTFRPVPDFDTIVGNSSTVYDPQVALHSITMFQENQVTTTTTSSPPSTTTTSSGITSSTTSSPSTTTTTIKRCLSESIYGGYAEETKLLRHFRDNVLRQTAEGRELINLYYLWSPVIVSAMEGNDEFRTWVKELIDDVLPVIQEAVE